MHEILLLNILYIMKEVKELANILYLGHLLELLHLGENLAIRMYHQNILKS